MKPAAGITVAIAAMGIAFAAPSAHAAVTCSYDPGGGGPGDEVMTVDLSANGDVATLSVVPGGSSAINVNGATCANTTNTANILVNDNSGGTTTVAVDQPVDFQPGTGADDVTPEIEFLLNMNTGTDLIRLTAGSTKGEFVVGGAGANYNATPGDTDADITYTTGTFRRYELVGGAENDKLSAQGGGGTLTPFASGTVTIDGAGGNDTIEGGNGALGSSGDQLTGGNGNDTVRGFAAPDRVFPGIGDDTEDGGTGGGDEDRIDYSLVQGGVNVDLAAGTQQGHPIIGNDTLSGFEEVIGTGAGDTLSGDGATNILQGGNGNDLLNGRGAIDGIIGGGGNDTITYADAAAAVNVNLTAMTVTGGSGNDSVMSVENVTGSPFADTLTGDANANSLTGLAGTDTISALAGPDIVDVRDGEADTASCGTEVDTALADQLGVDDVNPDCETVDFAPEPDAGGGGGGGLTDTEIAFDLSGKAKQKVLKQKGVVVKANCPLEDCTATASGTAKLPKPTRAPRARLNLKPVTEAVAAGVAEKITLKLKRKQLRAIASALRDGKKPKLTVTASVTDAAGNAASDALTVKVKR